MEKKIPGLPGLELNNLFCIGRNYARHAAEMNSEISEEPIVFMKPNSSLLLNGGTVHLPKQSANVHYEVELVIAIGKEGRNIDLEQAGDYIAGVAVGIDFTARDIQEQAKRSGHPWSVAKGFDTFAPVSRFQKLDNNQTGNTDIELFLNGVSVQKGNTREMIYPVPELICYLSSIFTLQPGDFLFTGTPAGVGPVNKGDQLTATLNTDQLTLSVDVQ